MDSVLIDENTIKVTPQSLSATVTVPPTQVCKGAELIKLPSREHTGGSAGGYGSEWTDIDPRSVRSNESDLQ